MATIRYGDRIAREGRILVGCSVVVLDDARERFLLTRRTDNGRWCVPGGALDPGETISECAVREVKEETGLDVALARLVGIYSDPNRLLEYADGNKYHLISMNFEAAVTGGALTESNETSEFRWCSHAEISDIDLMEHHVERIEDALANAAPVFVK